MKKNIRRIKKIEENKRYYKKNIKEEITEEEKQKDIVKCEIINQEIEDDKSKFRLVNQSKIKHKKEKVKKKETLKLQENRECFQLVVIENIPWYKKAIKVIGKFFKKNKIAQGNS